MRVDLISIIADSTVSRLMIFLINLLFFEQKEREKNIQINKNKQALFFKTKVWNEPSVERCLKHASS